MPLRRFLAPFLASLATVAFALDNPPPLFELDGAAHFDAIHAALQADRPDEAYIHARAWARREPQAPGPQAALARAYLGLDAPAAALEAVDRALRLAPLGNEARSLRMLKIQAHAEVGEWAAAWANARALLREPHASDDPFVRLLEETKWRFFAGLFESTHAAALEDRLAGLSSIERDPLTPERIARDSAALHEDFARRLKDSAENREAVFAELMRFAALHQHHGPWYDPYGPGLPFIQYADLQDAFVEYASGRELPVYGRWLRDRLPHESDHERTTEESSAPAGDLVSDLERFLRTIDPVWQRLRTRLEAAFATADAARTAAEIENAWDALDRLVSGPLANVLREVDHLAERLATATGPVPADVREAFARWRPLAEDPLIADARFRTTHPAPSFQVITEEAYNRPDELAHPLGFYVTETQAARSLFARWVQAVLAEEAGRIRAPIEALETARTPGLAAFDLVIARDLMTPALWEQRLRAAEAAGDWPEIVWSAYQVHRDKPGALEPLLRPRLAAHDARVAEARTQLRQPDSPGHADAFAVLLETLDRDPAHAEALAALFETLLENGSDEAAIDAYLRLWQLDLPETPASSEVLALAVRLGDWPFLLEAADRRVLANEADFEAHFHRQLAAAALGLSAVARESTPFLTATPYHPRSAVLEMTARGIQALTRETYIRPDTGLKAVQDLLGANEDDPAVRLWLGLVYRQNARQIQVGDADWQALETDASPVTITHLDFIRGALPLADYLDTHRDTPEEPTARFLERYLDHAARPTPESRARLAELGADFSLPLLLRVAAHEPEARASAGPIFPFRRSSRLHVNPWLRDWTPVWDGMAPGQTVVAAGNVRLASVPHRRNLRLVALVDSPIISAGTASTTGRLWELEGVIVNGPVGAARKPALEVRAGSVLAASGSAVAANAVAGAGRVWLEDTDWHHGALEATALHLHDVIAIETRFRATTRFEAQRLIAHDTGLTLGRPGQPDRASGQVHDSYLHVTGNPGFAGSSEIPLRMVRSTLSVLRDEFDALRFSAHESRLIAAAPPARAPEGFAVTVLNRFGEPDHRVTNLTELVETLARAKPGEQVLLAAGEYLLLETLRIPEGVSLRGESRGAGKNDVRIVVPAGTLIDPLIAVDKGAVSISRIDFDVVRRGTRQINGITFQLGDALEKRRALVAGKGTTLFVDGLTMNTWGPPFTSRSAILADQADVFILPPVPNQLTLANGSRIIAIARPGEGVLGISGTGEAYLPYARDKRLVLSGAGLRFHGRELHRSEIRYENGADSPRNLIWRTAARERLRNVLEAAAPELIANLDAHRDTATRMDLVRDFTLRMSHLVRAAAPPPEDFARALARLLNPGFLRHHGDLPFLFEALHIDIHGVPVNVARAHLATFDATNRERIRAHFAVISREGLAGQSVGTRQSQRIAYLKSYPPGHYAHGQAFEALVRGEPFADFHARTVAEQARRAQAARLLREAEQAAAKRKALEDYEARRKAELEEARQRQAEFWSRYAPQPRNRSSSASGWSSSSSSYRPYQPSASRQLQDYRRQLDTQIHNVGRGYGQGRRY